MPSSFERMVGRKAWELIWSMRDRGTAVGGDVAWNLSAASIIPIS